MSGESRPARPTFPMYRVCYVNQHNQTRKHVLSAVSGLDAAEMVRHNIKGAEVISVHLAEDEDYGGDFPI